MNKHNTEEDLWLVLEQQVYDMSKYQHPGGFPILKDFAGGIQDAQEAFDDTGHSKVALAQMRKLHIGSINEEIKPQEPSQEGKGEASLNDPESLAYKFLIAAGYLSMIYFVFLS